jgi:hypothetical protein
VLSVRLQTIRIQTSGRLNKRKESKIQRLNSMSLLFKSCDFVKTSQLVYSLGTDLVKGALKMSSNMDQLAMTLLRVGIALATIYPRLASPAIYPFLSPLKAIFHTHFARFF